jgi:ABC-type lipoprotein release transport system permease subunit
MYKFLLCWRYLRTRWIAFASIISVTLGVATMIVVNSVMEGFRYEMQERIHSILSDVVFESNSLTGFYDVEWHMKQIREVAGEHIEGMSATVVVPAMLSYQYNDRWITRPVQLIGVDEKTQSRMGDLGKYLQHPANREQLSFLLRQNGYDTRDHQAGSDAKERPDMSIAGWEHRRRWVERQRMIESMQPQANRPTQPADPFGASLGSPTGIARTSAIEPVEEPAATSTVTLIDPSTTEPLSEPVAESELEFVAEPDFGPALPAVPFEHEPRKVDADGIRSGNNPLRERSPELNPTPKKSRPTKPQPAPQARYTDYQTAPATVVASADEAASQQADLADHQAASDEQPATDQTAQPGPTNPFGASIEQESDSIYDPAKQQLTGVVLGIGLASYRDHDGQDRFLVLPGDDVKLSFPTAGTPPEIAHPAFTVVDFYESKMSEYDASFVFVPIEALQKLRGMYDPDTQIGYASSIQIKLKPGSDGTQVRDMLRAAFVPQLYTIQTWRDKQGPLLAAVQMETAILNVLLFMIIAVAGFGILAIFFMIVVEKTRDIGILKSLGASRRGVQGIFLGYGLLLGLVGAGAGMTLGLLFVAYINEIADLLGLITGQEVFDPAIYYFQSIPTIVQPFTVSWIVIGALAIAVLASVLPARRASRLHPVEALRYE